MAKVSAYVSDPKVRALCEKYGKEHDIGTMFAMVDHELGLKNDPLARAMYVALCCGTNERHNVASLLSMDAKALLNEAYANGEIGVEYITRWREV